jgi:signal transduction histidine kinase
MNRIGLRSRFLALRLTIAAALTAAVILIVRHEFLRQTNRQIAEELKDCAQRLRVLQHEDEGLRPPTPGAEEAWTEKAKLLCSCEAGILRNGVLAASSLHNASEREALVQLTRRNMELPSFVELGEESYGVLAVAQTGDDKGGISTVLLLRSQHAAKEQLADFTRLMTLLAAAAMAVGFLLVVRLSDTFARPLGNLVEAVKALERGDFSYPVAVHTGDELAEVTQAFEQMRTSLQETQKQLLRNERLATIGQMASSISHDLRYPLTTVVANAEFLSEETLDGEQRQNLHQEIRMAVELMNDLIESLLEFSRGRETPRFLQVNLEEIIERAVRSVQKRSEFQAIGVCVEPGTRIECEADPMKLERALRNLLINACEAAPTESGRVEISARELNGKVEIRVVDNGVGVAQEIRGTLFQPFVSLGKATGTGLGLAVVQKICRDHGGEATLESSEPGRTVFKMTFPSIQGKVKDS